MNFCISGISKKIPTNASTGLANKKGGGVIV